MNHQLEARTPRGRLLVALADELARRFRADTANDDNERRTGRRFAALKRLGFLDAPAPVGSGGLGVESVSDLAVAVSRIARVDPALTRRASMHLVMLQMLNRQRRIATGRNDVKRVRSIESAIGQLVRGEPVTEPIGESAGQSILSDRSDFGIELTLLAGVVSAATALGIAEEADRLADATRTGHSADQSDDQVAVQLAVENAVEIAASRALLSQALARVERYHAEHPDGLGTVRDAIALAEEVQQAKRYLSRAAIRIADRAVTLAIGGQHVRQLARLQQEVRAGAFHQAIGDTCDIGSREIVLAARR